MSKLMVWQLNGWGNEQMDMDWQMNKSNCFLDAEVLQRGTHYLKVIFSSLRAT